MKPSQGQQLTEPGAVSREHWNSTRTGILLGLTWYLYGICMVLICIGTDSVGFWCDIRSSSHGRARAGQLFLGPLGLLAQVGGQGLDFGQVTLHFAPAIPERIIGVGVERALECPHPVLQEHYE